MQPLPHNCQTTVWGCVCHSYIVSNNFFLIKTIIITSYVAITLRTSLLTKYWNMSITQYENIPIMASQTNYPQLVSHQLVRWVSSWFQTSLPLTALPLHRVISVCHFKVATLSGHSALAFSPSGIALNLNISQLQSVTVGKVG